MENTFNGRPIEYGQHFKYLPEMDVVTQYNWRERYSFYMEESYQVGKDASPVVVWRIKSSKTQPQ